MVGSFCSGLHSMARSVMVRFFSWFLVAALLVVFAAGCGGSEKDKGINNTKDRPKAADKGQ
jgi:hypothetical protein